MVVAGLEQRKCAAGVGPPTRRTFQQSASLTPLPLSADPTGDVGCPDSRPLPNSEPHFPDGFRTEALLQTSEQLPTRLFEVEAHRGLENTEGEYPVAQGYRLGLLRDKFSGHLEPCAPQATLLNPLVELKILQDPGQQVPNLGNILVEIEGLPDTTKLPQDAVAN